MNCKLRYQFSFLLLLCATTSAFSQKQKTVQLNFNPTFKNSILQKDSLYIFNNDSFQISQCKFYISGVELLKDDKLIYKEKNSFHLIDIFNTTSTNISLKIKPGLSFNAIKFNLGIDSLTNSKGISTGALDPLKGMYWAWHSGFINLKLEGKSNLCKTRNQNFQFHLGGFLQGFNNMQKVHLSTNHSSNIIINVDVLKFLSTIDLEKGNHIMSPSKTAVELTKTATRIFSIATKPSL